VTIGPQVHLSVTVTVTLVDDGEVYVSVITKDDAIGRDAARGITEATVKSVLGGDTKVRGDYYEHSHVHDTHMHYFRGRKTA
jgi:hypothetical protein